MRARPSPGCRRPRTPALLVWLLVAIATWASTVAVAEAGTSSCISIVPTTADAQDQALVDSLAREIGVSLGSRWVRLPLSWAELEPRQGAYSGQTLASLDRLVAAFRARRVRVLITLSATPTWAQDRTWWSRPPAGYPEGPQPFYPVAARALPSFSDLAEKLARRYAGKVHAVEVWNEPNLWMFLYPQRTAKDPLYAAHVYTKMLRAYHQGAARAETTMRIVAGATGPVGLNDSYRTSPQRFAKALRAAGAARSFDVYSHHPYTPGGSIYPEPTQPPNDPGTTVTLYNLRTLLRLFPSKPFYLSEYAYSTAPSTLFGLSVSEARQARYLKQAFALAARYRQVKMLGWYLLRDQAPYDDRAASGVYTGLRRVDGSKKPAWYAFRHIAK